MLSVSLPLLCLRLPSLVPHLDMIARTGFCVCLQSSRRSSKPCFTLHQEVSGCAQLNLGLLSAWKEGTFETWIPSLSRFDCENPSYHFSPRICTSLIREFLESMQSALWRLHKIPCAHAACQWGLCHSVAEGSLSKDLENTRQAESEKKQHVSAQLWRNSWKEHPASFGS